MINFISNIKLSIYRFLVDHYPQLVIQKSWKRDFGYKIDWKNPRDLNEKIQWLICFGDTSMWPVLADKYRVRDYVAAKGYGHILPKLYGVWDNADKIDYDSLPEKFVLKCNHDCGSYRIVNKTDGFDKDAINGFLNVCLHKKFGYKHCEPHYNKIKPLIIAEEYLEEKGDSFSTSLADYKIWCFNGKPYCITVLFNRTKYGVDHGLYDCNWNPLTEKGKYDHYSRKAEQAVPRPEKLDELLRAASDLSEGLPEARMDFYIVDNQIYFGEITLTSCFGRNDYYTKEFLVELGDRVCLR